MIKKIDNRKKENQEMVMKIVNVFLEPELNNLLIRLSNKNNKTRSTYIRCIIKDFLRKTMDKIEKIDWNESNNR